MKLCLTLYTHICTNLNVFERFFAPSQSSCTFPYFSGDSVVAGKLLSGATAHSADGKSITGSLIIKTVHTGSGDPSDSVGADGDLYLDMGG